MALILRNGGSQSPDRWLREPRNNQSAKKLGASRDEVKSAILVGLPAVGLTIIDPLEAALKAFDGKSDQIL